MKKQLLVCVANFLAFGSILRTIYAEMGQQLFLELLVPSAVIFGTNMAIFLLHLNNKNSEK